MLLYYADLKFTNFMKQEVLHGICLSFALHKDKVFGLLRKIYNQYKKAEKSKF